MKTGVMICGHGSRSQSAVDEFRVLAEKLPAYLPDDWMTDYGYLEFANPVLRDGLDKLREAGCERILAVPGMLFAAMHSKNDIPTVLNTYAKKHGIDVRYGRELGVDPKMIAAAGAWPAASPARAAGRLCACDRPSRYRVLPASSSARTPSGVVIVALSAHANPPAKIDARANIPIMPRVAIY